MTVYIVQFTSADGAVVLRVCDTLITALLQRRTLRQAGMQAELLVREVDRVAPLTAQEMGG